MPSAVRKTSVKSTLNPQVVILGLIGAGVLLLTSLIVKEYRHQQNVTVLTEETRITAKTEEEFLILMISHHREAIDTSKYIFDRTKNETIKKFAGDTINNQSKEAWNMLAWYQIWYGKELPSIAEYRKMMPDLTKYTGDDLDRVYVQGMIDHHREAITLSEQIRRTTKRDDLKEFATNIISMQATELNQLKELLSKYETPVNK